MNIVIESVILNPGEKVFDFLLFDFILQQFPH